ncbi:MAG: DUF899 domain-containing protein [Hyphomicrobiales bacterium]
MTQMTQSTIVSQDEWLKARQALLAEEKAFTRARDALSARRRLMPWVKIDKAYVFDGPDGAQSLAQLFAGRGQLIVYHFMMGPAWQEGCKSCSFWADNFDPIIVHLNQRDVSMVAVSSAPFARIEAFKKRMGWSFKWVSSSGTSFNQDFGVSPAPGRPMTYNYAPSKSTMDELPGISVFARDAAGHVYHSYSCYARGLDMLNTAYHYLDLVPKGRDEAGLSNTMAWVKHHDRY